MATLLILHQSDIKATEDQFNKAANKLILALQKFYAIDEATTMVKKG